jgi:3-hydroxyacyl-[acyl-carrier-protein] dehydratase
VKFELLDKIESISDSRIVAMKSVSLAEEYLADHFPSFPVLPGVMMLEALTQAAGWLMHHRTKFGKSFAVLKEAKQLRYGTFLAPGNTLRVEVEFVKATPAGASFKAAGTVNGEQALTGRLEIAYFNLAEKDAEAGHLDQQLARHTLARWKVLTERSASVVTESLSI